ncbi:MAG: alkaline phosphatase family protein [Bacteroidales bacterium]|nr:alkaline phosphatase family protein [Bacteroidales bacterium]
MSTIRISGVLAIILLIKLSFPSPLLSQTAYIPPDRPKLVVTLVMEQFRYDFIDRFSNRFGEGGFKMIINEGTYCRNASYDFFSTQSAPAHATLSTGTDPRFHGIIADSWYHPLRDAVVYCTSDSEVNPVGGSFENGLQSPVNMFPSTFSDELEMSTNGKSKVFGVSMRDHAAILGAGHAADAAYWFDDRSGTWMSSTHYIDSLPDWVRKFNEMNLPETYLSAGWTTLLPVEEYNGSISDTASWEIGIGGKTLFPYRFDKGRASGLRRGNETDYSLLPLIPAGNTFTNDFAIRLIEEEQLGADDITDFLMIGYPVTDNIGHLFGPSSVEMADAVIRFDRDLAHLINFLNEKIGKKNYLLCFTAAHGVAGVPELLADSKVPSGRFSQNQALTLLRSYLNVIYGEGSWVKGYYEKQIYLNRTLIEDARLDLDEMQQTASRFLTQFSGVASAVPGSVIETGDFTRGYFRSIRNSYDPSRSGDIIINLKPGWIESGNFVTNHNSPYEYDIHVPLIWYGYTVNRMSVTRKVNMNEVAATLSALCRIQVPNACMGEPMTELFR